MTCMYVTFSACKHLNALPVCCDFLPAVQVFYLQAEHYNIQVTHLHCTQISKCIQRSYVMHKTVYYKGD